MELSPIMEAFVLHWGEMGSRWGLNRTVAQIYALLYVAGKPLPADEIADTLKVARSNVSTSIRELQSWGLIGRTQAIGDRRDHFMAETDLWTAAGRVADGVFIRVGTSPANLEAAVAAVRAGAAEARRDPGEVALGVVFHTVLVEDAERALRIGRSMAAGYYEYSPTLFEAPGLRWDGPPVEELQQHVSPDFHHTPDLEGAGRLLEFLPPAAAEAFCLHGDADAVSQQLIEVLRALPVFEIVVLHPVPDPVHEAPGAPADYMGLVAREVLPRARAALGGPAG